MGFNPAGGAISGASDVALSNPTEADIFAYNSTVAKWINIGPLEAVMTFAETGTLAVKTGQSRFYFPFDATIMGIQASAGTAPTGATIRCDILKNGISIFSGTNRVQVSMGANTGAERLVGDFVVGAQMVTKGDYFTVNIDQIGSTLAGSDLVLNIRYRIR